ncbi:MAG: MBOAT family protein [bacterium]|nr:MBOAT family protein [bacterium]
MQFSSLVFLFCFLPAFVLLFLTLRKEVHNFFLLMASLFFYAWGEPRFVLLLLLSIVINYLLGMWMDKYDGKAFKKLVFLAALAFNLGLLIYFKYFNFLLNNLGLGDQFSSVHLPIGISFFTFQALSYIIDIYRKTTPNEKSPVNFALYMAFFPKLVTGPITPYHNLSKQIKDKRNITAEDLGEGMKRFIFGLGKKVLIADTVAKTANIVFAIPPEHQTVGLAWLGIISYTLQIYFDFSGYTDMAVGIGRMCGFRLLENFNYPYIAKSIKDFWARWHISLAWWLRDYLFLPIAYAVLRKIKNDRLLNIKAEKWSYFISTFATFLLCGIWHGANWTFFIWGAFYGVLLIIEHMGLRKFLKKKAPYVRVFHTQLMVIIAWVFFRSDTVGYALEYLKAMFGFGSGSGTVHYPALYMDGEMMVFTIIGLLGVFPLFPLLAKRYGDLKENLETGKGKALPALVKFGGPLVFNLYLVAILVAAATAMTVGTFNPFIYFRF